VTVEKQGGRTSGTNSLITKSLQVQDRRPQEAELLSVRRSSQTHRRELALMAGLGRVCLVLALSCAPMGCGPRSMVCAPGASSSSGVRGVARFTRLALILTFPSRCSRRLPAQRLRFNHRRRHIQRTTPAAYRGAAVWRPRKLLLLWAWLLSLWSSLALFLIPQPMREVASYATAICRPGRVLRVADVVLRTPSRPLAGARRRRRLDPLSVPDDDDPPPMLYSAHLCTIPLAFREIRHRRYLAPVPLAPASHTIQIFSLGGGRLGRTRW